MNRGHDGDDGSLKEAIMGRMNLSEDALSQLESDCGPQQLCCGEETIDAGSMPEGVDLMTLRMQKQDLDKRKDSAYRLKTNRMLRKTCFNSETTPVHASSRAEDVPPEERVPPGEVVLIVQVYKPMAMPETLTKYRTLGYRSYKVQQEVAVLGSQTLRRLRQKILCISDASVAGDFSDDPKKAREPRASDLYKSGFFYIGDTFYNDMSDPSCRDYSEVIREWAEEPRRQVGPFRTARMEESKFEDLEIRLGYPYVYVHQGYCEHLIVFSDMRMIHPSDNQRLKEYPVVLQTYSVGNRARCMLCLKATSEWVTYENKRVTDDPFFFCDRCFKSYNYTVDGKKIGHFYAQPFLDWNVAL